MIVSTRNFYGVLRVTEWGADEATRRRSLIHGTILHGTPVPRSRPATQADDLLHGNVRHRPASRSRCIPRVEPLKVGVIGLGTGTIATYGSKGDVYRFYDINPDVSPSRSATSRSCATATRRSRLRSATRACRSSASRRKTSTSSPIDAFSSDAIPVHLITSEAVAIYQRHMKPGGVIAFHVTNRYLDLVPVVRSPRARRTGSPRSTFATTPPMA